eukprot:4669351-Karenia_brevis.AAC.1
MALAGSTSLVPADAADQYKGKTVFDIYPDIPPPGGLRLMTRILDVWGVPGFKGVNIDWFDPETGAENFAAHPENVRSQEVVEDAHSSSSSSS